MGGGSLASRYCGPLRRLPESGGGPWAPPPLYVYACLVFKFVPLSGCIFFCLSLSLSFFFFALRCWGIPKFGFPCVILATVSLFNPYSAPFSSRYPLCMILFLFRPVSAVFVNGLWLSVCGGHWWWGCHSRFFILALLRLVGVIRQLPEACAPAKPPALTHLLYVPVLPSPAGRQQGERAGVKVGWVIWFL